MPCEFRDLLEGIAGDDAHDVLQAGAPDVVGGFSGAHRIVLDGRQPSAGLAQAQAHPDGAVAAGRANLEHALRAGRGHEHAQEAPVLFGDRELALVGGANFIEQLLHRRSQFVVRARVRRPQHGNNEEDRRNTHRKILTLGLGH